MGGNWGADSTWRCPYRKGGPGHGVRTRGKRHAKTDAEIGALHLRPRERPGHQQTPGSQRRGPGQATPLSLRRSQPRGRRDLLPPDREKTNVRRLSCRSWRSAPTAPGIGGGGAGRGRGPALGPSRLPGGCCCHGRGGPRLAHRAPLGSGRALAASNAGQRALRSAQDAAYLGLQLRHLQVQLVQVLVHKRDERLSKRHRGRERRPSRGRPAPSWAS